MTIKLKLYILAALFVAGLTFAGVIIYNQGQEIKAQNEAFGIFKEESEAQREKILLEIGLLKIEDRALDAVINSERDQRKAAEDELNKLRTDYEATNFNTYTGDSLARFFSNRRRQR